MRLTVNDTDLYFDVEGIGLAADGAALWERPTVLALHGGPGFDHSYFKPALSPLAEAAQIVYLDQRGQGRSASAPVETYTLEQMADDAAAFCRALGIDRPTILGHSAGGFVALNLALRHPDVVGRLVLVDTAAATGDMDGAMEILRERRGGEAVAAAVRLFGGDFSEESMMEFGRLVMPVYAGDPDKAGLLGEAIGRSRFRADVAEHYFSHRAHLYDVRPRLGEIRAPTLVVVGDRDWLCPPRAARVIAGGIPGADLRIIPGAGHFTFVEQPGEFAAAVRGFLLPAVATPTAAGVGGI